MRYRATKLPLALTCLTFLTSASCGGGGGPTNTIGNAFCDKVEACEEMSLPSEYRRQCVQLAGFAFGAAPDPDAAVACLTATSCAELEADPEGKARLCLDVDETSYQCNGTSLHLCTNGGVCNDVDCPSFCGDLELRFVACGFSSADGFDQCLCTT